MEKKKALHDKKVFDFESLEEKVQQLTKENVNLLLQVRILEQNLHANMCEQNKSNVEFARVTKERDKFKRVLKDSAFAVQAAIKMDQWCILDPAKEVRDRKDLLKDILRIILQYREIDRSESMDTIASFSQVYEKGDVGFIPKAMPSKTRKSATSTAIAALSKDTVMKGADSAASITSVSSMLGSIKTVPSMQLVPAPSQPVIVPQDSLPSFTVTSIQSSVSVSEDVSEEEVMTDMEKQLAASKLEIQKSIMKDLAYSQMALASQAKFAEENRRQSKSVAILEAIEDESVGDEEQSGEKVADEHEDSEKAAEDEKSEQVEGEEKPSE